MIPAKLPYDEDQRLLALLETQLLDSEPEERFDRLTRMAKTIFDVPYVLISLIDCDRQWFKSNQGLDAKETERAISFCGHAILSDTVLEIENALEDERFHDNPLVTNAPNIRFYAGAPIYANAEYRIGTLCLIDDHPRRLSEKEKALLVNLASCVSNEVSSQSERLLREEREIFSSGPVFSLLRSPDASRSVHYASSNAHEILGYTTDQLCGKKFSFNAIIHPDDLPRMMSESNHHIENGINSFALSYRVRLASGCYRWLYDFSRVLRDRNGKPHGIRSYLFDQTAQRDSESALYREQQRLSDIIEGTRIGTWEWNVQTGETAFNERWAEIVGYTLDELHPISIQTWLDLAHPDDLKASERYLQACFNKEAEYYDIEARMRHKDGHWVWVHDRGKVVSWTEDGQPLTMSGTHADITEKKLAEQSIEEYAAFQALIFENFPAYIFVKDRELRIVAANEQFLNIYPEEHRNSIIGTTTVEEFDEQEAAEFLAEDRKALATGYSEVEETLSFPDGIRRTLLTKKIRFEKANGEPYLLGVAIDISKRIEEEKQKQALSDRLSLATRAAKIGIWSWDIENHLFDWDSQMYRLYGVSPSNFTTDYESWRSLIHPDDVAPTESLIKLAIKGTAGFDTSFRIIRPDNSIVHIQTSAYVERDDVGKALRMIGTNWDITEQKAAEQHQKDARVAAEEAARMKSDFLANMSHEIRTPINGILGMIYLAAKSSHEPEQQRHLRLAEDSATSLLGIINDILDFSKIEAGHLGIESIEFDLRRLLSDLATTQALAAQEKGLELCLDTASIAHDKLIGDPLRIQQVLNNLINNAVKFTQKGSVRIVAETQQSDAGSIMFRCNIRDTGIGLSPQTSAKLFQPFTQADSSTTRQYGGTGLGLSIVKRLCNAMGGEINVTSEEGVGSEFVFQLPLELPKDVSTQKSTSPQHAVAIAIIEIDSAFEKALEGLLEKPLYALRRFTSLDDASDGLEQGYRPDIFFVDQRIVNNESARTQSKLRQLKYSNCQLVLFSPHTEVTEQSGSLDALFDEKLPLPTTVEALEAVISRHRLMVSEGTMADATSRPASAAVPTPMQAAIGKRIMVIEDNFINREVTGTLLRDAGYDVATADNGRIALELLITSEPNDAFDLLLMDCQMPEMDGYEASEAIRTGYAGEHYRDIPIVALTADVVDSTEEKCRAAGMNSYLSKPIHEKKLLQELLNFFS